MQYLYEGQQALGEIRGGQLTHRLLTGLSLDETIARIAINTSGQKDAANSRIFMTDALSSVIAQLSDDNTATVQNSYGYSPYGESTTVGPDVTKNPVQYTSRENDGTGMMFYRARYYDPVMKRCISSDPIGLGGGMNTFGYVEGNPVSYADPLGLWSVTVGAYLGVGGQMTFGNDGGNGFMTARFGFGLGGGASYNPTGGIPGPVPQDPSSGGVVLSCSAKANFNAGPLSSSLEKGVARNYSNAGYSVSS